MTNETPSSDKQAASGSLRSLVQALDKLVEDPTSFLHLSLPDSTVAQIQKSFIINPLAAGAAPGYSRKGGQAAAGQKTIKNTATEII